VDQIFLACSLDDERPETCALRCFSRLPAVSLLPIRRLQIDALHVVAPLSISTAGGRSRAILPSSGASPLLANTLNATQSVARNHLLPPCVAGAGACRRCPRGRRLLPHLDRAPSPPRSLFAAHAAPVTHSSISARARASISPLDPPEPKRRTDASVSLAPVVICWIAWFGL
jgi:hypothetical protein